MSEPVDAPRAAPRPDGELPGPAARPDGELPGPARRPDGELPGPAARPDGELPGPARRLGEELDEDGVTLGGDDLVRHRVLVELDHARRTPVFEGRRTVYGAFVLHRGQELDCGPLAADLLDLDNLDLATARSYADGRSSFVTHHHDGRLSLACFERLIQYEADLVRIQEATGAEIVQRTAVLGAPRLFTRGQVVSWDGRNWNARPTAATVLPALRGCAPTLRDEVARGILDLAVHWLSPAHIGATLVIHDAPVDWDVLDTAGAVDAPLLSVANRRHFPALFAALAQHDLATVVSADGRVERIGVGLLSSATADATVPGDRGMRHRSGQRFSYDHPSVTVVVVSEDGPVTIFRGGRTIDTTDRPC